MSNLEFSFIRNIVKNTLVKAAVAALLLVFTSCAHLHNAESPDQSRPQSGRIVKVAEGIYRGPRLGDLSELKSLTIHTVLNLENNIEAVRNEEAVAKKLGIKVINIPLSVIMRPSPRDLLKAVEIMEDPGLQPIYVHCLHGQDRTGLAIAAYKVIHDGWTVDQAYQEAIDNGHKWWLYAVILKWGKSLRELPVKNSHITEPNQGRLGTPAPSAS